MNEDTTCGTQNPIEPQEEPKTQGPQDLQGQHETQEPQDLQEQHETQESQDQQEQHDPQEENESNDISPSSLTERTEAILTEYNKNRREYKLNNRHKTKKMIHLMQTKDDIIFNGRIRYLLKTLKGLDSTKFDANTAKEIQEAIEIANSDIGKDIMDALFDTIEEISLRKEDYIKEEYKESKKLFTKENCIITFKALIAITLAYGDKGLNSELLKIYKCDIRTPKPSALCNRREVVETKLFKDLFEKFKNRLFKMVHVLDKKHLGYWLLAVDGSTLNIPNNPDDEETHFKIVKGDKVVEYNQIQLHALYDVLNRQYIDAILAPSKVIDERKACRMLLKTVSEKYQVDLDKSIVIMDRGYDGLYQIFYLQNSGLKFVVRTKDFYSRNSTLWKFRKEIGKNDAVDKIYHLKLTKNKQHDGENGYIVLDAKQYFPYLEDHDFVMFGFVL